MWEGLRDGVAGFADGALSGLTFGVYSGSLIGDMMGADTSSTAYMIGNIGGNIAGSIAMSVVTAGASTAANAANAGRSVRLISTALNTAILAANLRDIYLLGTSFMDAVRCGDWSSFARQTGRRLLTACGQYQRLHLPVGLRRKTRLLGSVGHVG